MNIMGSYEKKNRKFTLNFDMKSKMPGTVSISVPDIFCSRLRV